MKTLIVIPARLASTRLPRKLLLADTGQTLIQHTYQAAKSSQLASDVVVAADDQELADAVEKFGGNVRLTRPDHLSGTDRVAEIAAAHDDYEIIVNVQGDEPELPGSAIDLAITMLRDDPQSIMSTLATPIRSKAQLDDPNCVKVVLDQFNRAMYFSRSVIPHPREWDESILTAQPPAFLQHIGLYAYRRDFLLKIPSLKIPRVESLESLEQLRILHSGESIAVGMIDHPVLGIDTREDYAAFVSRQAS